MQTNEADWPTELPASRWERYQLWFDRHRTELAAMVLKADPMVHSIEEQEANRYVGQAVVDRFDELAEDAFDTWVKDGAPLDRFTDTLFDIATSIALELNAIWAAAQEAILQWSEVNWRPTVEYVLPRRTLRWKHRARTVEILRSAGRDGGDSLSAMTARLEQLCEEEDLHARSTRDDHGRSTITDTRRILAYVGPGYIKVEGGYSGAFLERVRQAIRDLGSMLGSPIGHSPLDFCLEVLHRELASEREPLYVPQLARLSEEQLRRYCWIPLEDEGGSLYNVLEALKWYCLRLIGQLDVASLQLPSTGEADANSLAKSDLGFETEAERELALHDYKKRHSCSGAALARAAAVHPVDMTKWKKGRLPAKSVIAERIENALHNDTDPILASKKITPDQLGG